MNMGTASTAKMDDKEQGFDAEAEQRGRDEHARVAANAAAGKAAERRAGSTEEIDATEEVVAALASFNGMTKTEMARHLIGLNKEQLAALRSRFIDAMTAVDTGYKATVELRRP
ncbi:hypothetical protein N9M16_01795 [Candidatus Dependentiae bacterium]|nr:hypothetical protein [Candidatus Dependentiae bacterium]